MAGKMKLLVTCDGEDKYVHVPPDVSLSDLKQKIAEKFKRSQQDIRVRKKDGDKFVLLTPNNMTLKDRDQLDVTKKVLYNGLIISNQSLMVRKFGASA